MDEQRFEAILKENHLEWSDEFPQQGDTFSVRSLRPIRVYITLKNLETRFFEKPGFSGDHQFYQYYSPLIGQGNYCITSSTDFI